MMLTLCRETKSLLHEAVDIASDPVCLSVCSAVLCRVEFCEQCGVGVRLHPGSSLGDCHPPGLPVGLP